MKNQRQNTQQKLPQNKVEEQHLTVLTDFALWSLLFQGYTERKPHKYSKAEAFFDLLNRERLAALTGNVSNSFQTLANTWSWDRTTVKKFVASLCSIGVASVTTDKQKYTVRMKNIFGLPQQVNTALQEDHLKTSFSGDFSPSGAKS